MLPAVLREERQFRLLFLGQALSVVGDRLTAVVLPFAVLSIGGSVTDVGLVAAAGFLPFIVLGLVGGVLADRQERRRILVASDAVRLVTQLTAGLLLVSGHAEIWQLAALTALFGAADAFFTPAFGGLMPQTIADPHHLQSANALRGMSFSTGSIVGPALGGILVATMGEGGALLVDAATFAVSIACLLALRPPVVQRAAPEPFAADLRGGWREVRTAHVGLGLPARRDRQPRDRAAVDLRARPGADGGRAGRRDLVGDHHHRLRPRRARRRRAAAALAPALRPARLGDRARVRLLPGGHHRQRPADRRHRRDRVLGRHRRLDVLHAVGDVAAGAHPRDGDLARDEL
jgi:Transmembrane secretion effector